MRIGVIGYYGYGNAGDEVILENIRQFLTPHRAVALPVGLLNSAATIRRLNAFDFLILGGGGLYQDAPPCPFENFDTWGDKLRTPIGVLGLGVAALAPRFRDATDKLIEQSAFFLVRDEESRRILGHPKVRVAPDMTFYHPLEVQNRGSGSTDGEVVCGINLRPAWSGIDDWIRAIRALPVTRRAIPFSVHPSLGDREALLALDRDCPDRFTAEAFASIDLLVGTAFHSVVFAIQTGTPVVAINYDPKVSRLMHAADLQEYMLEWDQWDKLQACYERVLDDRDSIRRRMRDYTERATFVLQEALLKPKQIINTASSRQSNSSLSRQSVPRVSIIVNGVNSTEDELKRTLSSCLRQTYDNVEVLLIATDGQTAADIDFCGEDSSVRVLNLDGVAADPVSLGIQAAAGTYLTWLTGGAWFAEDAIALLVEFLDESLTADVAHACFFYTANNVIERRVTLHTAHRPHDAAFLGPCVLVRRDRAEQLWKRIRDMPHDIPATSRAVYVRSTLFFQPAASSERYLFRGLMAYSRGNFARGKQLFADALRTRDAATDWRTADDVVELFSTAARKATVVSDPIEFVELVFRHLPEDADTLRALKRRVKAHVIMVYFFATHSAKNRTELFRTAWRGVRNDPRWLHNRGVWAILWRALVTLVRPRASIARKRLRRFRNTVE